MMKIFSASQIKAIDAATIISQKITSTELMERAALQAFLWLVNHYPDKKTVYTIFCGVGNNGGDGLAIARMLMENHFDVQLYIVPFSAQHTPDFETNFQRIEANNMPYKVLDFSQPFPEIKSHSILIDAIFGTGLSRPLAPSIAGLIMHINATEVFRIAIDIPSGLCMQSPTKIAVKSDVTLTFQLPKLAFYLPDNQEFVNDITFLNIDLDPTIIAETPVSYFLVDKHFIQTIYKKINRFAHKGSRGHTLVVGGSYGKIGAVVLTAKAALKSGSGLVTVYAPKCGYTIVQTVFPEAMMQTDVAENFLSDISITTAVDSIVIGMGMGQASMTQEAFHAFLAKNKTPLVVDADALNILAAHKNWISLVPKNSVFTPHPKELERLIGPWENDFEKIEKAQAFTAKHQIVLLIKGAYTMIIEAKKIYVNTTANPALATAGSGDVLAGIIGGFLAQGYTAVDAAILGVYVHGSTADKATEHIGYESFIASDILNNLGKVFKSIHNT